MRPNLFTALAITALCANAAPCFAQTNPPVTSAPVEETADEQYRDAVALLRNGRKLEIAIAKLRNAVRQKPDSAEYHLALGCALTSRAISVADASRQTAEYPSKVSDYKNAIALWESAQTRRSDILYGQARPLPPTLPATKDDGVVFRRSKEQAEQAYDAMAKEAIQEWEAGLKTARTDDAKAQAYLLAGWGKSLLRVGSFDLKLSADMQQAVTPQKCADAVNAATTSTPNDPAVWRGVGDISLFDYYVGKGSNDFQYNKEATQAYERSVELNKKALDLWYVLFLMESRHDTAQAETALNQALRLDSGNAFLWYEKAYFIPHRVSGSLAVDTDPEIDAAKMNAGQWYAVLNAIEQGNRAGRFQFVGTGPQPPLLLALAWRVCAKNDSLPMYRFVTTNIYFQTAFAKNIGVATERNDTKLGQRWSLAAVDMGQLLCRDILSGSISPISPSASTTVSVRVMTAKGALQIGYDGLIDLQRRAGNTDFENLLRAKERATATIDAWSKAHIDAHKSQFSRAYEQ